MCGLYGRVSFGSDLNVVECLRRTKMLEHRGPDFLGHYTSENVFLGHTRLSILDLSPSGNQPFGIGKPRLAFNGEIYNWRELKARYLGDIELNTRSDTEVLYELLRKMGPDCLPLLNGMFSLAFYDGAARKIYLARDTVGIKPLYLIADSTGFEFSSEIKNLRYSVDAGRLNHYLCFGTFGEDYLPFGNVREIPPGSFAVIDCLNGTWTQTAFQEIESFADPDTYSELSCSTNLVDRLDELLQRSIRIHEQSDAPIGYLCSGGLDSSLITAMAAKRGQNMALYHADFEGGHRELDYAQQVASHVGAPLRTTTLGKELFWRKFAEITYASDLPVQHPHAVSLNLIAQRARNDDVKVLLAGDGADELFMGYWFYSAYASSLSQFWGKFDFRTVLRKAQNLLRRNVRPYADPYWYFANIQRAFQKHAHVGFGGDCNHLSNPLQGLALVNQDFKPWKSWQRALETYSWLGDNRESNTLSFQMFYMRQFLQPLLHRLDRMLMNTSVEGRVPFLENDLMRFALNLEVKQKANGNTTKYILKELASRYLPQNIVHRRKQGFSVPFADYVTGYPNILNDGFVSDWTRLSNKELRAWCNDDLDQIYRLVSIEVWGRIFVEKTPWADIDVKM